MTKKEAQKRLDDAWYPLYEAHIMVPQLMQFAPGHMKVLRDYIDTALTALNDFRHEHSQQEAHQ